MHTCTVGQMRVLLDSVCNVVPYVNLTLKQGTATFTAFDTHQSVLCTAQLPVSFAASGCAYMHVPSCRAALRSVNATTPLTITVDNDSFTMAWARQRHTYTHVRVRATPSLGSLVRCGAFIMPSADLLKFARDTMANVVTFKAAGDLLIRAVTDVCVSEYTVPPFDDPVHPFAPAPSTITCTTKNLVSIAKAALFHKSVIITVCVNEVLIVYRKDLATHVSFVLARAL